MSKLKTINVVVPANGTYDVASVGTFLFCMTSTGNAGDITIQVGNGTKNRFDVLDKYKYNDDDRFESFKLYNGSGSDVTLKMGVGDGDISINATVSVSGTVTTNPTRSAHLTTTADVTLSTNAITTIIAANTARRAVMITNLDAGNSCRVGDLVNTSASRGQPVAAGQCVTIETTAAIAGFAVPAGVKVSILEIVD